LLFDLRREKEQKTRELQENRMIQQRMDDINRDIINVTQEYMQADMRRQETEQRLSAMQQKINNLNNISAVRGVEELQRQRYQEKAQLALELKKLEEEQPNTPIYPTPPVKPTISQRKPKKTYLLLFAIMSVLLGVGGGVALGLLFNWVAGGAVIPLFVAFGCYLFVVDAKNKKAERLALQQEQKILAEYAEQEQKYQTELQEYQNSLEACNEYKRKADEVRARLSGVEMALADLAGQLNQLAPQGVDKLLQDEKTLKTEYDNLRNRYEAIIQKCSELKNRLIANKKELNIREEKFVLPSATEGEIENISEKIAQGQKKYNYAKKAIELLLMAKQNLTQNYLPKLNRLLNENLSRLGNFEFEEATVDANFEVLVRQSGQFRELGYLSTGCRQLCQFALRVSLMQCIYGGDLPLLVLDDPFVNFDSENFASAYGLLQKLADNTQILYLTCHDR